MEDATWIASQDLVSETQGRAFTAALAGFASGNPFATAGIFTAAINWGDGATSPGTIQANGFGGFNVVDGHHRIRGLVLAAEKEPSLDDFEVPVNIAVNLDPISQMAHFLIVNTTQR